MPEIKQIHDFIKANDNMEMLTISMDSKSSTPALRKLIREKKFEYPVLHVNAQDGWNDGAFDWHITGVPSAFIIDPMGNIFSKTYPAVDVIDVMKWLGAQDSAVPITGLSVSTETQDDGSLLVAVQMSSPTHAPLDVEVDVTKMVPAYNPKYDKEGTGENNTNDYIKLDDLDLGFRQKFEIWGEAVHTFIIPAQEDAQYISFIVKAKVPGMEDFDGGQGYSVSANKFLRVNQENK